MLWRRYELIIGALLATAFWAVIILLQGTQQQNPRIDLQKKAAQSVSGAHGVSNFTPSAEHNASEPKARGSAEHAENSEILGVKRGEWLLFLATLGLWYATWRLVKGADQTAERQLRAYILGNGGSMKIFNANDGSPGFAALFQLKNFGQTPAGEFRSWIKIGVFDSDHDPFDQKSLGLGTDIVGPADIRDLSVQYWPIDNAIVTAVNNGTKTIFIWGVAEYRDVFGHLRFFNFHSQNGPYSPGLGGWPIQASNKPHEAN